MKNSISDQIPFVLSLLVPLMFATTAVAQIGPYGNYYGGWGAHPYAAIGAINSTQNTMRTISAERQAASQQQAAQRSAALQSSIRDSLASGGRARAEGIANQQRTEQDWWFQQQQRKMAENRARESRRPAFGASAAVPRSFVPSTPQTEAPQASTDIIKWPTVLRDARFAQQRTRVEEPFRRVASGGTAVTVNEYRAIVDATQQMQNTLEQMSYEISAGAYQGVEKFLLQLADEARGKIASATPPATGAAAETSESSGKIE